jgi:hypothetical protein
MLVKALEQSQDDAMMCQNRTFAIHLLATVCTLASGGSVEISPSCIKSWLGRVVQPDNTTAVILFDFYCSVRLYIMVLIDQGSDHTYDTFACPLLLDTLR